MGSHPSVNGVMAFPVQHDVLQVTPTTNNLSLDNCPASGHACVACYNLKRGSSVKEDLHGIMTDQGKAQQAHLYASR